MLFQVKEANQRKKKTNFAPAILQKTNLPLCLGEKEKSAYNAKKGKNVKVRSEERLERCLSLLSHSY